MSKFYCVSSFLNICIHESFAKPRVRMTIYWLPDLHIINGRCLTPSWPMSSFDSVSIFVVQLGENLPIDVVSVKVSGNFGLGTVTISEKFLLVVKQFFACFGRVFGVLSLYDGVDGACFLAEAAVDALGHVNIIFGCSSGTIQPGFGLDSDSLSGANGFTELASNAPFFSGRISTQCVFTTETWAEGTFLERVHDGVWRPEELLEDDPHSSNNFCEEE